MQVSVLLITLSAATITTVLAGQGVGLLLSEYRSQVYN